MATENNAEMENKSLQNSETPSPLNNQLDRPISSEFEGPKFDLLDFDMLLDIPVDMPSTSTGITGETQPGSCEESDCDVSKKRKPVPEYDLSFLDLLDDIFVQDKAIPNPLDRLEELLNFRLAGSPETKRQKTTTEDDQSFAKPKTYSCRYCPKEFYSSILCHDHQVRHTKELLTCTWCGNRSRTNSGLRRHIQYYHQYSSMCHVFFDSR